jgi:hypothetical protein
MDKRAKLIKGFFEEPSKIEIKNFLTNIALQ